MDKSMMLEKMLKQKTREAIMKTKTKSYRHNGNHKSGEKLHEALHLLGEIAEEKKEQLGEDISRRIDSFRESVDHLRESGMESAEHLKEYVGDAVRQGKVVARKKAAQINRKVHQNPWPFIGGAALGAFILGLTLRNGHGRKNDAERN